MSNFLKRNTHLWVLRGKEKMRFFAKNFNTQDYGREIRENRQDV